ncbi:MAG: murein hydrolase activator EnvC family protein [Marmoricola sp.]
MPLLAPLALALAAGLLPGTVPPVLAHAPRPPVTALRTARVPGSGTWPLVPGHVVVHGFDPPSSPWGAGHRGVDLLGVPGEEVHAALAGTVTFAGRLAGRGVVVIDHGGRRTTYEPVAPAVAVGSPVATGAVIGHLQSGASHCLPLTCLHWGLIRRDAGGDTYLDPLTLVGGGPVRLKPLDGLRDPAGAGAPYPAARALRLTPLTLRPPLAPLMPLAQVLRRADGPGDTPPGAARW